MQKGQHQSQFNSKKKKKKLLEWVALFKATYTAFNPCSLGIKPITLVLMAPLCTVWVIGIHNHTSVCKSFNDVIVKALSHQHYIQMKLERGEKKDKNWLKS